MLLMYFLWDLLNYFLCTSYMFLMYFSCIFYVSSMYRSWSFYVHCTVSIESINITNYHSRTSTRTRSWLKEKQFRMKLIFNSTFWDNLIVEILKKSRFCENPWRWIERQIVAVDKLTWRLYRPSSSCPRTR